MSDNVSKKTINPSQLTPEEVSDLLTSTQVAKVLPDDVRIWIEEGLPVDIEGKINILNLMAWLNLKLVEFDA